MTAAITWRRSAAKPDRMKELGVAIEKVVSPLAPVLFWAFFAGAFLLPALIKW